MRKNAPVGPYTKQIAHRVRALREANKVRAADTARILGFSQGHWSQIENGKYPFDVELLKAIADVYGVTLSSLLEDGSGEHQDKLKTVLGLTVSEALGDPKFLVLVVKLAQARKKSHWLFEACVRLSKL